MDEYYEDPWYEEIAQYYDDWANGGEPEKPW